MSEPQSLDERRRFIRIEAPVLVEFKGASGLERSFTRDISEAGMRFPTSTKLTVGQKMDFSLGIPPELVPIKAAGEIIWVREVARVGGAQYDAGVRFTWLHDPDKRRLLHQLNNLLAI